MAIDVLIPFDFNRTELLNAKAQNLGVDPAGLAAADKGLFWLGPGDTLRYWDGAQVRVVGDATGGNATTLGGEGAAFYLARENHTGAQPLSTITGHTKAVHDAMGIDAGTLSGQTSTFHLARANHTGTQPVSSIAGFADAVDARIEQGDAATVGGIDPATILTDGDVGTTVASLVGGIVPTNQLPAFSSNDTYTAASQAEMLALGDADIGDVAIRSDLNGSRFLLTGDDPSVLDNWAALDHPADAIQSVNVAAPITTSGGANPTLGLADLGVTGAKVANAAITAGKLANNAVDLPSAKVTGTLPVSKGGTGVTTLPDLRTALGSPQKVEQLVGGGATGEYTVTHGLNTRGVKVEVVRNSAPWDTVLVDVERPNVNDVLVRFAVPQAADSFNVVVVG